MSVTKEIVRLEKSNVRLNLTVPKEEVQSQYRDLLKDYAKDAQIPGFRKGKVPQEILIRKFGEALKDEAVNKIIGNAVEEVFGDEGLPSGERPLPYSQPQLKDEPQLDIENDLSFSIEYDVMPTVTVGQWKGLEVEAPDAEVTDEDIARELEEIRDRNAFVLDREEDAQARTGDVVTVNFCEIGENGETVSGTERQDFAFTLGSGQNVYKIDDDITGMKKGETREFSKTYPEGNTEEDPNAGKTIKLKVELTALKEKKLPDLDDELAQDVDEKYNTLDDLKNSIRERLERNLKARLRDKKINKILEKIMENTPVTLPESMIRVELDGRLRSLAQRFGTDTNRLLSMLAQTGDGLDDIQGQWRPSAEKALHSRLIVEELMKEQNIEAGEDEVTKEMETIAEESGISLEEVQSHYKEEDGSLDYIRETVKERKFFDLLLAENTVKTGSKTNYLDVMSNNG